MSFWAEIETPINEAPLFPIEPRDRIEVSEHWRQSVVVQRCSRLGLHAAAVPNARAWGMKAWNKAKKEGVRWGHSDLIITGRDRFCAFVEMKDGLAWPEQHQIDFLNYKVRQGFPCAVARSADWLEEWLRSCGAPVMERAA